MITHVYGRVLLDALMHKGVAKDLDSKYFTMTFSSLLKFELFSNIKPVMN